MVATNRRGHQRLRALVTQLPKPLVSARSLTPSPWGRPAGASKATGVDQLSEPLGRHSDARVSCTEHRWLV